MTQALAPDLDRLAQLLERLGDQHSLPTLTEDVADLFATEADDTTMVLLVDDPKRAPEVWDVAVVLPEVLATLRSPPISAVADLAASRALAARYDIRRFPALLFRRGAEFVGVIEGMRDWDSFGPAIERMSQAQVQRAPGIGIPVRASTSDSCGGSPA
ncbi:thioredoxin domain-containing protein [Denitromonas ohlonensis]|uniref:Hydrogenase expression/formation protein n=2 Tax=Denitromonas TaxID=139331 RepID=A0A557S642_9RHOO|nr:hydrogenase [Denitromonas ohlonensis]TVO68763.1 hydrogenase [Denitromonas ohlonensis]TVO72871.1 hydrogenase [Denitromonas ohlonensis]